MKEEISDKITNETSPEKYTFAHLFVRRQVSGSLYRKRITNVIEGLQAFDSTVIEHGARNQASSSLPSSWYMCAVGLFPNTRRSI